MRSNIKCISKIPPRVSSRTGTCITGSLLCTLRAHANRKTGSAVLPGTIGCHLVATQQGPCQRIRDSRFVLCPTQRAFWKVALFPPQVDSTREVTKLSEGSTLLTTDSCPTARHLPASLYTNTDYRPKPSSNSRLFQF